ncbi:MAG TPA: hypothetical protein VJC05_02720 [Candidatus Andersenbacteria bacterium]|nr:hypothetical protein [Candidatus Andersenbacteria bacterium]
MTLDPTLLSVIADVITDLSAGAFAAAFLVPITSQRPQDKNVDLTVLNLALALFCLAVAWQLRMLIT